jgi:hypothetical protein
MAAEITNTHASAERAQIMGIATFGGSRSNVVVSDRKCGRAASSSE